MRILLTPRAKRDTNRITDFYEEEAGSAEWFVRAFRQALAQLQAFPLSGVQRTDVARSPVRLWLFKQYHVVYRVHKDMVQVLAVLHSAQDMRQALKAMQ